MQEQLPRVLSFPFQLRFLFASRPQLMGRVLGIVYRAISSHLIQKAGFTRKTAQTGAVTLIQRFGSALNLNVHFHMLFLDGVYTATPWGKSRFHGTNAPERQELTELVHTIIHRVAGFLEREGILERDEENSYLNLEEGDEDPMQQVLGCSVSYRIAVGYSRGARYSRCRPSRPAKTMTALLRSRKWPVSACTPEPRRRRGNGRSWRGYADIFQDQRYRRNDCH